MLVIKLSHVNVIDVIDVKVILVI